MEIDPRLFERLVLAVEKLSGSSGNEDGFNEDGFVDLQPKFTVIYPNTERGVGDCLWYTLDSLADGEKSRVAAPTNTIKGLITDLRFPWKLRKGKPTLKTVLTVSTKTSGILLVETGWPTEFGKSIVAALADVTPSELLSPATLEVYPGNTPEVLFARITTQSGGVPGSYSAETDWGGVVRRAIDATMIHYLEEAKGVDRPGLEEAVRAMATEKNDSQRIKQALAMNYGKKALSELSVEQLMHFQRELRSWKLQ